MAATLGEFEHLILLAILQLGREAHAARVREKIEVEADRKVTRGALYVTLDRLTAKRLVEWEEGESTSARGGIPRRRFRVTNAGVEALRRSHAAVRTLSRGLERVLGEA
jgi:PadR family transcriptional regulator, regulatory protein PadR